MEQITNCQFDFKGRRWKRISEQAKAFVEDLLVADPRDRATANEAMCHIWLNKGYGATVRGPTPDEIDTTTNTIKKFATYTKLKKLALMVVAHKSTSEEIGILRKVFQQYDSRGDGYIRFHDFKRALKSYGFSTKELREMFDGVVSLSFVCVSGSFTVCLTARLAGFGGDRKDSVHGVLGGHHRSTGCY